MHSTTTINPPRAASTPRLQSTLSDELEALADDTVRNSSIFSVVQRAAATVDSILDEVHSLNAPHEADWAAAKDELDALLATIAANGDAANRNIQRQIKNDHATQLAAFKAENDAAFRALEVKCAAIEAMAVKSSTTIIEDLKAKGEVLTEDLTAKGEVLEVNLAKSEQLISSLDNSMASFKALDNVYPFLVQQSEAIATAAGKFERKSIAFEQRGAAILTELQSAMSDAK